MTQTVDLICLGCKYWKGDPVWRGDGKGCDAFPEGIPDEVLLENKHDKPLNGQDNDLVFTPREEKV